MGTLSNKARGLSPQPGFHSTAGAYRRDSFQVIPVSPNAKGPPRVRLDDYKAGPLVSYPQLTAWWRQKPGQPPNIAILCGEVSKAVAADVDPDKGHTWKEVLSATGLVWPETCVVTSSPGHAALWYALPDDWSGSAPGFELKTPGGKIQIRGDGQYQVVPPSVHPAGHTYTGELSRQKMACAPDWLLERLTNSAGGDIEKQSGFPTGGVDLEAAYTKLFKNKPQNQHEKLIEALDGYWPTKQTPGVDRSNDEYFLARCCEEAGLSKAETAAVVGSSAVHEAKTVGRTDEKTRRRVLVARAMEAGARTEPRVLSVTDVLDIQDPGPTEWVVDGVLPEGYMLLTAGRPKMGKTQLLLHLVACIAQGQPFAGRPTKKSKVLALFAEDDAADVRKKLLEYGLDAEARGRVLLPQLGGSLPNWDNLLETAREHDCRVVIIDPQAVVTRLKPGCAGYEEVYDALYPARQKIHEYRLTGIANTHVSKGRAAVKDLADAIDGPIGTTAYSAVVDGVAAFGQHPNDSSLRRFLGHGRKGVSFDTTWVFEGGLYRLADTERGLSALAQDIHEILAGDGHLWTATALREAVNRSSEAVNSALEELRKAELATFVRVGTRIKWTDCSRQMNVV